MTVKPDRIAVRYKTCIHKIGFLLKIQIIVDRHYSKLSAFYLLLILFYSLSLVDAVLGQSVELPCNVTSEKKNDKLNILAWYRNGSTTAFYR